MLQLPDTRHDLALWLLQQLEQVDFVGNGAWAGTLPSSLEFLAVTQKIEAVGGGLGGIYYEGSRSIEFYPQTAGVYETLDNFFAHPGNLRLVPSKFTIRELSYTSGDADAPPEIIANYLAAAKLCALLPKLSDHSSNNGNSQHFIKSHDAKIEVRLDYRPDQLVALTSLDAFEEDFIKSSHHQDQKRNIIRATLLEIFKGKRCISIGDLLPRFNDFIENARSSYVMYTADFSYEKIRTEVEKQNLEDAVRINKTVSDIQNQLLALPAALVLAGAGIDDKSAIKNYAIWIGISIFSWLMIKLINNQKHSVNAIETEICFRESKLSEQPEAVASRFSGTFVKLKNRVDEQKKVLNRIYGVVGIIWIVVSIMAFSVLFPEWMEAIKGNLSLVPENFLNLIRKFLNYQRLSTSL